MTATATTFLAVNKDAVEALIDKVVDDAMKGLPCLSMNNPRPALRALIEKAITSKFEGGEGCTGAWETDDVFVVTVNDVTDTLGEVRVEVSLCLAEVRIRP